MAFAPTKRYIGQSLSTELLAPSHRTQREKDARFRRTFLHTFKSGIFLQQLGLCQEADICMVKASAPVMTAWLAGWRGTVQETGSLEPLCCLPGKPKTAISSTGSHHLKGFSPRRSKESLPAHHKLSGYSSPVHKLGKTFKLGQCFQVPGLSPTCQLRDWGLMVWFF